MEIIEITATFVDLVIKYGWVHGEKIAPEEEDILLATVTAAGFEPLKVVHGCMEVEELDEERNLRQKFRINTTCPYVVIDKNNDRSKHATGWLNQLVYLANTTPIHAQRLRVVHAEIERSIPLAPITITNDGDVLRDRRCTGFDCPHGDYFIEHTKNRTKLIGRVGIHDTCGHIVERKPSNNSKDVLLCRGCYLRVPFSKEVATYGQLRAYFARTLT